MASTDIQESPIDEKPPNGSILKRTSRYGTKTRLSTSAENAEDFRIFLARPHPLRAQNAWMTFCFYLVSIFYLPLKISLTVFMYVCGFNKFVSFLVGASSVVLNIDMIVTGGQGDTQLPAVIMAIVAGLQILTGLVDVDSLPTSSLIVHKFSRVMEMMTESHEDRNMRHIMEKDEPVLNIDSITSIRYNFVLGSKILELNSYILDEIEDALRTIGFWIERSKVIANARIRENFELARHVGSDLSCHRKYFRTKEWVPEDVRRDFKDYAGFIELAQNPTLFKEYMKDAFFTTKSSFFALPSARIIKLLKEYEAIGKPDVQYTWYTLYLCPTKEKR